MSRSWLLAVRSPGLGSRPPQLLTISVRSSSESRGSYGRVSTGYSRTNRQRFQSRSRRSRCGWPRQRKSRAVASDRHPAGNRICRRHPRAGRRACLWRSACRPCRRNSERSPGRCWRRAACLRATRPGRGTRRRPPVRAETLVPRGRRGAVARNTSDLFRTAKTSSRGCSARSIGRPVKAIEPASIRCPDETRKLPSGWRPIQTGRSCDMPHGQGREHCKSQDCQPSAVVHRRISIDRSSPA